MKHKHIISDVLIILGAVAVIASVGLLFDWPLALGVGGLASVGFGVVIGLGDDK